MSDIPREISIESLPGPKRGEPPTLYYRDELVRSPSGTHFALAYTIDEVSMGNEVGCVLWGATGNDQCTILGNPEGVHATCWYAPWTVWLDDETFVFKAQYYDGEKLHLPLVAVNVYMGFSVIPGTNNSESRPSQVSHIPSPFKQLDASGLLQEIGAAANHSLQARQP